QRQHDAQHHADTYWPRDIKTANVSDTRELHSKSFATETQRHRENTRRIRFVTSIYEMRPHFSLACSVSPCLRGKLLSPLHLIAKDAFDDLRIGAAPSAEQRIVDCKRILDGCEFLVFLIQSVVCGRTKIELNKRSLCLFTP